MKMLLAANPGMDRIIHILDGLRNALVAVLVTLSLVALTYAGVRYAIADGDATGVEKGKGAAKPALVGRSLALRPRSSWPSSSGSSMARVFRPSVTCLLATIVLLGAPSTAVAGTRSPTPPERPSRLPTSSPSPSPSPLIGSAAVSQPVRAYVHQASRRPHPRGRLRPIPTPSGPLSRFLQDPQGFLRGIGEQLREVIPLAVLVLTIVAALLFAFRMWRRWREAELARGAKHLRILSPPQVNPAGSRMLWMGLHALLRPWWRRVIWGQPHVAWEVTAGPELVEVSLWVPRVVPPGLIERAVHASWPGATTVETSSDPISCIGRPGSVEVTQLVLAEREWFPIGTPGGDSLALALAGLTGLADGEAVAIQVLARPATSGSRRRLRRAARSIRAGTRFAWRAGRASGHRPVADPATEGDVRAVLAKASSHLWSCSLRVAVSSPRKDWARGRMHGLAGGFAVFEGRNGFRRSRWPGGLRRMRARRLARSYLLSVPELAEIATLPPAGAVAGLERGAAGTVPPSRVLPRKGKILGKAEGPGADREVAISVEDARHHLHVIGETGTGKSTLLARLVLQEAEAGRSAVVIDPKGDLVEAILERLPEGAVERTCLIDPDDSKRAVGLNVLGGGDRDLTVEHVLGVFRRIYEPWWGPRTDDIMRAACLTLTQIPGTTLVEVPLLLTNFGWRRAIRNRLTDIAGIGAFWDWYERLPEGQRAQHIAPLLNKLRAFLLRGPVRAIVGQPNPKLDVSRLLDSGGLLLVRIPKGTLGEETSRLLGAFVVARVWQAAMKRAARPEAQRPDTALYVDEMHNYLALPRSFEDLLAEARGYRLSLVLAHQHLGQLPSEMRDALAANARTKICFTCSPEDAVHLEHHFAPELTAYDLSHLRAFQVACRPSVGGGHGAAFTFTTESLGSPERDRPEAVRAASQERFGADRVLVELLIRRRHQGVEAGRYLLPSESQPADASSAGDIR
jgi:hypothetical protein